METTRGHGMRGEGPLSDGDSLRIQAVTTGHDAGLRLGWIGNWPAGRGSQAAGEGIGAALFCHHPQVNGDAGLAPTQGSDAAIAEGVIGEADLSAAEPGGMSTFFDLVLKVLGQHGIQVPVINGRQFFAEDDRISWERHGSFGESEWPLMILVLIILGRGALFALVTERDVEMVIEPIEDVTARSVFGVVGRPGRIGERAIGGAEQHLQRDVIFAQPSHPERLAARRKLAVVFIGVHREGRAQLFEIIEATDPTRALLGATEGRQQHAGQNGDDGDNDEEFDEGECAVARPCPALG